jgi:hypothetical protein
MEIDPMRAHPLLILFAWLGAGAGAAPVDFNRDIRPILSDKCFHCHGPDATNQKSEYRLDTEAHAREALGGGRFGIVPGHPERSEVMTRVRHADPGEVMPPPDLGRPLTPAEIATLERWIREGAAYDQHWAFKRPVKPVPPAPPQGVTVRNPIDAFVTARLAAAGLAPAPEADRETLLRRASLAITGLPPTPAAVRAFLADTAPDAYAQAVERLLDSDDYAERQALLWLDAARYADTDGYQNDNERSNWPWRDWVIQAFRSHMPFDRFTLEQLAGDMLPNPTPEQRLATAFNRNHRQNAEGGALAAEFLVENVIDRVETTGTVWLGLTLNCARCHNHKYDPISQEEFFRFYAYFNNIGESGTGAGRNANPILNIASALHRPAPDLLARLEQARQALQAAEKAAAAGVETWAASAANAESEDKTWFDLEVTEATLDKVGALTRQPDGSFLLTGENPSNPIYTALIRPPEGEITGIRLDALPHDSFGKPRQLARSVNGNFVLSSVTATLRPANGSPQELEFSEARATFQQSGYPVEHLIDDRPDTGWGVYAKPAAPETVSAALRLAKPLRAPPGSVLEIQLAHMSSYADHNVGRFKLRATREREPALEGGDRGLPAEVLAALRVPAGKRNAKQKALLAEHRQKADPAVRKAREALAALEKEVERGGFGEVPVMVMREREGKPTPTYLLERGQYDAPDKSRELPRGLPAAIHPGGEMPGDRLALARWLVSRDNPLTARVTVNRIWQQYFGIGLVKTCEDFGSQGELPPHAELLDWLAVSLQDSGWDLRALHRAIATSATFRQASKLTSDLAARDPENRLLARGPRFRVDGFMVRDIALHASGLLVSRLGGPPVKPYQPDGLWTAVNQSPNFRYVPDKGEGLYRKTLYTYWKRAVNPPGPTLFDAAGRETCNVNVRRTNTPLQALALLNDVTYIEAARHLARRALGVPGADESARLEELHLAATGLRPSTRTREVLAEHLRHARGHFGAREAEAQAFLSHGDSPRDPAMPVVEHAAWASVAHLVLNLDRTITLE